MTENVGKSRGIAAVDQPAVAAQYYGTFQGVANYPPLPRQHQAGSGLPQPAPPPGAPPYYSLGYQTIHTVPGYAVAEGRPIEERRLPCCGIGIGWLLFLCGFLFGTLPWYIGAFVLLCARVDYREKPGLIACTLAAVLSVIAISLGVTKATHAW